jgi:CubicO group peptidase (beta-lactamase class C family)
MKRRSLSLILIFSHLLSSAQNKTNAIDSVLNYMHGKYFFDGVVLVAKKDSVMYKKAFGLANRDWKIENRMDTKFRLGSMSKQFIGFLTIILAEEGRLKLTDPLGNWLPEFSITDKKNITIQNLLTHTSGIYDYTDMPDFNSMVLYPEDSLVKMMASHALNFPPSEKYSYSNSNFYLLTVIAEKVSGKKFEDLLKEKILIPAGMNNSGIDHNDNILTNRASPYIHTTSGFINGEYIQMDNVAGGMYSTAFDLLNWSVFIQKKLARDKFLKSTLQPFRLTDGTLIIYSCGWCLMPGQLMHQGHINGFANQISIDTINHHTIIILSNDNFKQLYVTGKTISSILNKDKNPLNWISQKIPLTVMNEYTGIYVMGKDSVWSKIENGEFTTYYNGHQLPPWLLFIKDEFFSTASEGNIVYIRNKEGRVTGVNSFDNYHWDEWKKVR